ncbi:MAG: hypothetical protein ABSA46_06045 [Thermodesulfovibrionales bacterium]|jgi:hypothetical protein
MNINTKRTLLIVIGILLLATAINYFIGTIIVINGRQVTGIGGYITAYLAMLLLTVMLVIAIPSALILGIVLVIVFGILLMVFFPLLPFAFPLLPGIVFVGIVYLIYKRVKKKK